MTRIVPPQHPHQNFNSTSYHGGKRKVRRILLLLVVVFLVLSCTVVVVSYFRILFVLLPPLLQLQHDDNHNNSSSFSFHDNVNEELHYHQYHHHLEPQNHPWQHHSSSSSSQHYSLHNKAQYIIQKSYAESYGRMIHHCESHVIEKDCIHLILEDVLSGIPKPPPPSSSSSSSSLSNVTMTGTPPSPSSSYPWWYITLLRDIRTNGVYGPWHHLSTSSTNPPMRFCAMGKNACTEWRRVFQQLNRREFCNATMMTRTTMTSVEAAVDETKDEEKNDKVQNIRMMERRNVQQQQQQQQQQHHHRDECKSHWNTAFQLSHDPSVIPNVVFIRDPLERLLSAYLDKCIKPNIRKSQGHCEPNSIFGREYLDRMTNNDNNNVQKRVENSTNNNVMLPDLAHLLRDRDKELFAAYVDLLPLKWNVHFVPQALTCDLYRTIHTYDFVGVMGKHFMFELDRMVHRYSDDDDDNDDEESSSFSLLALVLNETFHYQSKLKNESIAMMNVGADNQHGTKAPSKVTQYYSARSVRRALEYLSIDYVTFGLEVPEWAIEMLLHD